MDAAASTRKQLIANRKKESNDMKAPLNHIWMQLPHYRTDRVAQPNAYEFRASAGYHWLQRLCFWTLDKLGCHQVLTVDKVEYTNLQSANLKDAIFKTIDSAMGWAKYHPEDYVIVMGAPEFRELCCDRELTVAFGWRVTMDIYDHYSSRVMGVPIAAMPWARGMVLVPAKLLAPN